MKGSVYVLKNASLGPNVLKIGMTLREPGVRAKEFYAGSSGVPKAFDLVCSVLVGNCREAERRIHKRLASYRINSRREFFRVPPQVAADFVFTICCEINAELGLSLPVRHDHVENKLGCAGGQRLPPGAESSSDQVPSVLFKIPLSQLQEFPIGNCTLTREQKFRADVLDGIFPTSFFGGESTSDSLLRDMNPERELRVMEHIAKAFLSIDQLAIASKEAQVEAFHLLLERSCKPSAEVLDSFRLKNLTRAMAKNLLASYELKPYPLIVWVGK
ncbi:GIY-YIG nuclease family protein [Xanthomonas sp. PPL139]|uniref:GIY-YIG nuclease family protein n=1 Tax=unclassified Xanthomonas TaxID=2643310 RepID=UPI0033AEF8BF